MQKPRILKLGQGYESRITLTWKNPSTVIEKVREVADMKV